MITKLRHLWLLLMVPVTASAQGIYPGDAVRVNDETISYQRFQGFYVEYRNSKGVAVGARGDQLEMLTQLRKEAMDLLIEQELVAQAAEREGIEVDPAMVDARVEETREAFEKPDSFRMKLEGEGFTEESFRRHVGRMMAAGLYLERIRADAADVSDAEVEAYYAENKRRLTLPEQVRVRHILLKWKPMGTADDRAAIHRQMEPIFERARSGEDFAALAREYSEDSGTREEGGDTGFFQHGAMVKPFEEVAFALEPGEISDPVETGYGLHIIRVEEHKEAELLPLDEVREFLRDHVREEKTESAVRAEIDELRAAADVEVLIPVAARD